MDIRITMHGRRIRPREYHVINRWNYIAHGSLGRMELGRISEMYSKMGWSKCRFVVRIKG